MAPSNLPMHRQFAKFVSAMNLAPGLKRMQKYVKVCGYDFSEGGSVKTGSASKSRRRPESEASGVHKQANRQADGMR